MDLDTFRWLLTPPGQALLAQAEALDLGDAARLASLGRLRRVETPERAAAAYELAALRLRARAKFPQAAAMYFTREALEQASGWAVASHRARRYARLLAAGGRVADLCCGAGGDALALASHGLAVAAVDRDELRLAMAEANAAALGLAAGIQCARLDVERDEPPPAEAIFFDPARRAGGRRVFDASGYEPPLSIVARWLPRTPAAGVKVAPGISDADQAAAAAPEVEFVSLEGELKEAALWYGPLAEHGRRATLLAGGAAHELFEPHGHAPAPPPASEPLALLYEPDPAVIRAHLVARLAHQIGAAQLDASIAYLTAERAEPTPFARRWRVLEWLPFALKRLRARLRALDAGPVTVKKRGSPLDTDALARQLSGPGPRQLVVVLTQVAGRPAALICEGPIL